MCTSMIVLLALHLSLQYNFLVFFMASSSYRLCIPSTPREKHVHESVACLFSCGKVSFISIVFVLGCFQLVTINQVVKSAYGWVRSFILPAAVKTPKTSHERRL